METITLLGLSGSLRKQSYNTAALVALCELAPATVTLTVFDEIANLPLFNPDREDEVIPALEKLKTLLQQSQGLIIASPEYAHGITGVLKNALDWLVSGEEFVNKPVMLINTSPRAHHAQDALREVLTTMSGNIVESATVAIELLGSELTVKGIIDEPEIAQILQKGLKQFCLEIKKL